MSLTDLILLMRKDGLRVKRYMRAGSGPRVNVRAPSQGEYEIEHPLLGEAAGTHRAFDPASLDDDNGGGYDR